jgi:hypothetical protein
MFSPISGLFIHSDIWFFLMRQQFYKFESITFVNSCCYFLGPGKPIQKIITYAYIFHCFSCFPVIVSRLHCVCVCLFLGFLFCFIGLHVCFCVNTELFPLLWFLVYVRSGIMIPPALLFLFKFAFAIWGLL